MFSRSPLSRFFRSEVRPPPSVPSGATLYAVGDIHGRADLLSLILQRLRQDAAGLTQDPAVIFLGDYVDRGPQSRQVIDQLIAFGEESGFEARFLRGNHDQSVLDFLFDPSQGPAWCDFGGRETLMSYGVTPPRARTDQAAWAAAARDLAAAMPERHLAFFRNLELSLEVGDYFFAHAGVRPGVALDQQSERDLLWIREPFLGDSGRLDKVIVHGHTPTETVHADERRIGVDTGAYATDVLTALKLNGTERTLIQTSRLADRSHGVESSPLPELRRGVRG